MLDMKKKWDILLILAVLVIAAGIWLFTTIIRTEGAFAVVTVDGKEYGRYALSEDLEKEIQTEFGKNYLVISGGAAKVTEADCPDRLCVNQREIRYNNESIICLPHKLTVTIEGGREGSVDAVAERRTEDFFRKERKRERI